MKRHSHITVPGLGALVVIVATAMMLSGCDDLAMLEYIRSQVLGDQAVVYVSPDGADSNSGFTTESAMRTIGLAMERAAMVGAQEVQVAEGSYSCYQDEDRITLHAGVSLMGGYSNDFSQRDPDKFVSSIQTSVFFHEFIDAVGSDVQDASIDGFTIEVSITETEVAPNLADGVITIHSGASISVVNNRFIVDLGGSLDEGLCIINQWTNDENLPAVYDLQIHGNVFEINSDMASKPRVVAIRLGEQSDGSHVTISANRFAMDCGTPTAIELGDCPDVDIWNNVIRVSGDGDSEALWFQGSSGSRILHNTVLVADGGEGNGEGVYTSGSATSDFIVHCNIFAATDSAGCGVQNNQSGTLQYTSNLCCGFDSETIGNITSESGNEFVDGTVIPDLFLTYDNDISDGDSSDYHLDDLGAGGPYAVDRGSADSWVVGVDIDGDARPQGTAIDRGADEKLQ